MSKQEANALVQQAAQAMKANNKAKAKDLLLKAVDMDENNEMAWLWMSGVVDTPDEQLICLENVLKVNPNNDKAKLGVQKLKAKIGNKPAAPKPAAAPPPPAADPFAALGDSFGGGTDPFGSAADPFGGWGQPATPAATPPASAAPAADPFGSANDPFSAWGQPAAPTPAAPAAPTNPFDAADPFASLSDPFGAGSDPFAAAAPPPVPTSVDWGKSDTPAAGSGKKVQQPSSSDYDDWISNMGIGQDNAPATPSTPAFDTSADPWGSGNNDPWGGITAGSSRSAAPKPVDPFIGSDEPDPWGGSNDAWGATSSGRGASTPAADPFGGSSPAFEGDLSSSFDEPDPFPANRGAAASSRGGNSSGAMSSRSAANAFESSFGASNSFSFDEDGSFFDFESDGNDDAFVFGGGTAVPVTEDDPFAELEDKPQKGKKGKAKAAPQVSGYYQYLPEEFKTSGGSNRNVMIAAGVLGVLNVFALIGVLLA